MSKTTQEWITFENLCSDTEGREAVAEVVRLHRAFEEWATQLEELSADMESKGHYLNSEQIDAVVAGIHYILEGGNYE